MSSGVALTSAEMDSRKLALLCRDLAEKKKGENIAVLDVRKLSTVTDYFVIVSGTSEPHLRAITDEIIQGLQQECGLRPHGIDGTSRAAWVVLDYYDVIVHVMRNDLRQRYDLDGLWGDAKRLRGRRVLKS